MPFDPQDAERVKRALSRLPLLHGEVTSEKKMFGGLCFLQNGKMLLGVEKERLMVRLSDDELEAALADGTAGPMDFTGKPMRNFAYVPRTGWHTEGQVLEWAGRSAGYVRARMLTGPKRPPRYKSKVV
ncbi:MAG: TfoX/Sxy family protein [Armatimonadetes bacterium]|nr:TfoX/Sxy family protein [Armatimonadota bacterium]